MDILSLKRQLYQCDLENPDLLIDLANLLRRTSNTGKWHATIIVTRLTNSAWLSQPSRAAAESHISRDIEEISIAFRRGEEFFSLRFPQAFLSASLFAEKALASLKKKPEIIKAKDGDCLIVVNFYILYFERVTDTRTKNLLQKINFPDIKFEVDDEIQFEDYRVPNHLL